MDNKIEITIEDIENGFLLMIRHESNTYAGYGEKKFFIKDKKALKTGIIQELDNVLKSC